MTPLRTLGWLLLAVGALGTASLWAMTRPEAPEVTTMQPAPAFVESGLKYTVPLTGEEDGIAPAAESRIEDDPVLRNMLSRSSEGLEQVYHPEGYVSVDLQGRFQSATIAVVDADGTVRTQCVDSAEGAAACTHSHQPEVQ